MNQYSKIRKIINSCEIAYISCFSKCCENEQIIRYRDSQLVDMYDHNFTFIKKTLLKDAFQQVIQEEIEENLHENKDFCKIAMDELPDEKYLEGLNRKLEIEHYGEYVYIPMKSPEWSSIDGCQMLKVTDPSMIEDLASMDLIHDSGSSGEDFCNRRARRRGEVYLSEIPLDSYICYFNGIPVGNCDLFLHNSTAKIEDFAVLPEYQRRGIGTAILKCMIDTALMKGAATIYLIADEDDTAKEMYLKLRFVKIADSYALFGKL